MTDLQHHHIPDPHATNGGGGALIVSAPAETSVGAKRQRRPSVRLGDIGGDQSYDSHSNRRPSKQWKVPGRDSGGRGGPRTRPVTNLSGEWNETLGGSGGDEREGNLVGKLKRASNTKRVRSNWTVSKADDDNGGGEDDDDLNYNDEDQSPINSLDNIGDDREGDLYGGARVRVSKEFEGPSDTDTRNWNSGERNGVRVWLNQLGLGRYAPVFEIHEVDDEVLPLLTLEDLKDMGINAVGSRRKMYCAIQKLSKGFS